VPERWREKMSKKPIRKAQKKEPVPNEPYSEDGFYTDENDEIAYNPNADLGFFDIQSGGAE
jgi:hypothetical protein